MYTVGQSCMYPLEAGLYTRLKQAAAASTVMPSRGSQARPDRVHQCPWPGKVHQGVQASGSSIGTLPHKKGKENDRQCLAVQSLCMAVAVQSLCMAVGPTWMDGWMSGHRPLTPSPPRAT